MQIASRNDYLNQSSGLPHSALKFFKITGKTCGKIFIHRYTKDILNPCHVK